MAICRMSQFIAAQSLILDIEGVISPANSFGFMDGGIDSLYRSYFGRHVQDRLQKLIRDRHYGELVVGAAEIVDTDNPRIPYLIAAPTMRVPDPARQRQPIPRSASGAPFDQAWSFSLGAARR